MRPPKGRAFRIVSIAEVHRHNTALASSSRDLEDGLNVIDNVEQKLG